MVLGNNVRHGIHRNFFCIWGACMYCWVRFPIESLVKQVTTFLFRGSPRFARCSLSHLKQRISYQPLPISFFSALEIRLEGLRY